MSEDDLKTDPTLRKEFEESQYQVWKRRNAKELSEKYAKINPVYKKSFEMFCRRAYRSGSVDPTA